MMIEQPFRTTAAAALLLQLILASPASAQEQRPSAVFDNVFGESSRILDLTYTINDRSPYWPGDDYQPFELKTIATLEEDGVLSKTFSMPEHLGTHIDAPNHFEAGRIPVDEIPPEQLFGPGVVIDIEPRAEQDADTMLSPQDIEEWEAEHGAIPEGAIVLLHTGWGRHWENIPRYQNRDPTGQMHFPSYSPEAAELLVTERNARGIGVDNLSIDRGLSKDFKVHHIVNKAGRFGLENVARLDELPPRGFWLIVSPIKIEDGSGGPARIWAVVPGDAGGE